MTGRNAFMPCPPQPVNWPKVAFLWAAAITLGGWIAVGAQAHQRLAVLEARTQPLADGDLAVVQRDVEWIRRHLERAPSSSEAPPGRAVGPESWAPSSSERAPARAIGPES